MRGAVQTKSVRINWIDIAKGIGILLMVIFANVIKSSFLGSIGKNSIYYYGIHIIVLQFIQKIILIYKINNNEAVMFILSTLSVLLIVIILNFGLKYYECIYRKVIDFIGFSEKGNKKE